ncbi:8-oxo-dGTP diphosphatase [Pseudarthrobacter sp. PS3-L1]|uniref:8-oxo-dGTP diphosphatase n=1 Tax=Pseudarthrobacter sp. PS3-L1 TaxID=3046207 RepID=UPI0024BAA187|nr:8-oxo-dGTP diphosphatase [Pseudarthrobacter sp. PS3-L1]MDJ0320433.1 8-oxo-dGTP diphosphatase [Pseudarthrobacter sp. PS3-L1]
MTAAQVTLCFLLRNNAGSPEVLLGFKRTGFGRGKIVGVGGHVEPGETVQEAICREVREEICVEISQPDLDLAGTVDFVFPNRPEWNMFSTVFVVRRWKGEPVETEEITPGWYKTNELPVEHMWADAEHWVPEMIAGGTPDIRVVLAADNESVASVSRGPQTQGTTRQP